MHEARATKIRLSRVRDEESLILKDEDLAVVPLLSRTSSNTSERRQSHERLLRKSFDKNFIDREAVPCEEGEGKFCNVCYEYYHEEDFFALKCGHEFCVNCVADHLRINIEGGNAMKLPCMQQGCKVRFGPEEIQSFCTAKIFNQYNNIREDVRIGKSSKLKWCARPGCEHTVRRPACFCFRRRAICQCGHATCWKCGETYHDAACQVSGAAGFMMHNVNSRVSKCPLCKSMIYKPDGCNHMACSRCKGAFCWICRRDISDVHYDHFSPENMFGCNGMTEVPQCILCWVFLMILMIIVSPIAVSVRMGFFLGKYALGKCIGDKYAIERMVGYER